MNKQNNFYVVSGGPGAGKTSLLDALAASGYQIVPEDARKIIRQQLNIGGDALPWKDKTHYLELMLEASLYTYHQVQSKGMDMVRFFDRGIIDALCYAELIGLEITKKMDLIARHNLYHPTVFLLPPWKEIYRTDAERKQSWSEAEATFVKLKSIYTRYGYQIIELPKVSIEKRRDFVLQEINSR